MRVTPTDINAAEPFQVEFKILNTGTAPIELPVSPHLSDLQPSDESVAFNYSSLALVVRGEAEPQGPPVDSIGFVELFGLSERAESVMVLRPGEWIRVTANIKLLKCPSVPVSARFRGDFWLRRNTLHPHPDRKRVVYGKSVDLGGRRIIKKKKRENKLIEDIL